MTMTDERLQVSTFPRDSEKAAFENVTCGRCGGSGRYSFNLMDGDRCYGCGGRGYKFTKRGALAQQMYAESLKVPACEVEVGQKVRLDSGPLGGGGWMLVTESGPGTPHRQRAHDEEEWTEVPTWTLRGLKRQSGEKSWDSDLVPAGGLTTERHRLVRVEQTNDEKREKIDAALRYEASLTKMGKPRKIAR